MASWLESVWESVSQNAVPMLSAWWSGNQVNNANADAARLAQEGKGSAFRAIQAGQADSMARYDAIAAQGQPGNAYLRTVMAQDPTKLTPQQQLTLAEQQRQQANILNTGPLRGSGRAITASLNNGAAKTQGDMIARNTGRADDAARVLSGQGQQASMQAAGVPLQVGQAMGQGEMQASNAAANAGLASAGVNASTLAGITAMANRQQSDEQAQKRYQTVTPRSV